MFTNYYKSLPKGQRVMLKYPMWSDQIVYLVKDLNIWNLHMNLNLYTKNN